MKKIATIICLLFISSTVFAQNPKNRLYKIHSDVGDSYILGTIHIGVELNEFKTDVVDLIKKSNTLLPEIDVTLAQLETYRTDPFKVMFDASPLPRQTNPNIETVNKLIALGFPKYIAEHLPDNACMSLQMLLLARPKMPSLDLQVLKIAHQNHLQVLPLDSAELRTRARKESDSQLGACSLSKILGTYTKEQILESLNSSLLDSVKFYKSGDLEKAEFLNDPIVSYRNLAWMSIIEQQVKKGRAFISVGYSHLDGSQGLLQLLSERGFRVTLVE